MRKIKLVNTTIETTTGECCPASGLWKATTYPLMPARIAKGKIMPPQLEKSVKWELTPSNV